MLELLRLYTKELKSLDLDSDLDITSPRSTFAPRTLYKSGGYSINAIFPTVIAR